MRFVLSTKTDEVATRKIENITTVEASFGIGFFIDPKYFFRSLSVFAIFDEINYGAG